MLLLAIMGKLQMHSCILENAMAPSSHIGAQKNDEPQFDLAPPCSSCIMLVCISFTSHNKAYHPYSMP